MESGVDLREYAGLVALMVERVVVGKLVGGEDRVIDASTTILLDRFRFCLNMQCLSFDELETNGGRMVHARMLALPWMDRLHLKMWCKGILSLCVTNRLTVR